MGMGGFPDAYMIYTADWAQCWDPHHLVSRRKRGAIAFQH